MKVFIFLFSFNARRVAIVIMLMVKINLEIFLILKRQECVFLSKEENVINNLIYANSLIMNLNLEL
jgi:hypothetical protein